jgi:hypothetical protein
VRPTWAGGRRAAGCGWLPARGGRRGRSSPRPLGWLGGAGKGGATGWAARPRVFLLISFIRIMCGI